MSMVDHIVVAVDFSEPSRVAVKAAMQLAYMAGAKKLTVLHALRPTVLPHGHQPELERRLAELKQRIQAAAREQMRKMALATDGHVYALEYQVVEGTPAKVIPLAARDVGGTLLAVGTHARRGIRRWLNGSVVEAMLHRLHLPTLVMHVGDEGVPPDAELASLAHSTVAIDTHDAASLVATRAREALTALGSKKPSVTLTTVVDVDTPQLAPDDDLLGEVSNMIKSDAQARLERLREPFVKAGFETDVEVRSGDVEDEILEVAKRRPSQLIVMGTHTGDDSLLEFHSTAAEVIRNSNVSVLVLPCHRELDSHTEE